MLYSEKVYEIENYVVILDKVTGFSELYPKDTGATEPIATHKIRTVLCVVANRLQKEYDQKGAE